MQPFKSRKGAFFKEKITPIEESCLLNTRIHDHTTRNMDLTLHVLKREEV